MSKVIIWIRHAHKEYNNSKGPPNSYQHDSPLASNQEENIINKGKELINKYGFPDRCIVSPFKRTRDTAKLLISNTNIPIEICTNISEYLGNQRSDISCIDPSTAIHSPPLNENFNDLVSRCSIHLSKVGAYDDIIKSEIIWIVTHGIVIKTISKQLNRIYGGLKINDINELDAFILTKNYSGSRLIYHNKDNFPLQLTFKSSLEIDNEQID